eukprot:CAMPEP_0202864320 /NCGR_PEP_ID=MMETSP1391-20130828/4611_1 /ASSEMBLY_ACC=CAM_ASM_000867 /TAXON_ID=1034604 /ORGANISM="Chlamydomonas leiostraca, Strain SAG 11-49" /LENGTH=825 /DNA_ID=CAMNT_0049544055 /DNA_START=66 /DNA_END=2539 /DNA_ORIENTATION=+
MSVISQRDSTAPGSLCRNLPKYIRQPPIEAVVFAWGTNEDRALGLDGPEVNVTVPKVVESLLGVQFSGRSFGRAPLVGGSRNTMVLDSDGQVWSMGWNDRGTLGLGHRGKVRKPQRLGALTGVRIVQVAVNGWHCLALSDTGQMFAWGGNEYLQCAVDPEKRDVVTPVPCLPQLRVRQVACGGMHSLALTETGEVWTWGEPWGDFSMRIERTPLPVPGATGMVAIAAGAFHNMALSKQAEVYTWGTNDYGQLGNGYTTYNTTPCRVKDMEGVQVADITAGGWHSLALTRHGEVYAWGRGEYGRLGIGDRSGSSKLRPHKVRGLEEHCVVQMAAGGTHTLVLTGEGRMFVWGRGSFGRLGLGAERDCYSPVECPLPGGHDRWRVISIATGGRHSMCLALPVREGTGSVLDSSEVSGLSEDVDGMSEPSLCDRDMQYEIGEDHTVTSVTHANGSGTGGSGGPLSSQSAQPTPSHPQPPTPTLQAGQAGSRQGSQSVPKAPSQPVLGANRESVGGDNSRDIGMGMQPDGFEGGGMGLAAANNQWPGAGMDMHRLVAAQMELDAAAEEEEEGRRTPRAASATQRPPPNKAEGAQGAEERRAPAAASGGGVGGDEEEEEQEETEEEQEQSEDEDEEDQGLFLEERRALSPMPRPMSPALPNSAAAARAMQVPSPRALVGSPGSYGTPTALLVGTPPAQVMMISGSSRSGAQQAAASAMAAAALAASVVGSPRSAPMLTEFMGPGMPNTIGPKVITPNAGPASGSALPRAGGNGAFGSIAGGLEARGLSSSPPLGSSPASGSPSKLPGSTPADSARAGPAPAGGAAAPAGA